MASFERRPAAFWAEWQRGSDSPTGASEPEPQAAHEALTKLVQRGTIDTIITQNADGLQQAAGTDTEDVIELHRNATSSRCRDCRYTEDTADTLGRFTGATPPSCPDCGGHLKPDAVLFGKRLPREPLNRARALFALADVLLVIGTSLTVEPAAALPARVVESGATVIVNDISTTPIDDLAAVRIERPAEGFLPALAEAVAGNTDSRRDLPAGTDSATGETSDS